jgi:hypothetical protein
MALLHTGRVLMFSGRSESDNSIYRSWSWDPTQAPSTAVGRWIVEGYPHDPPWTVVPGRAEDPDGDLFCSHHVFLRDGRLLVVGGDHFPGMAGSTGPHTNASLHVYDPVTEGWTKLPDRMRFGRWYPTAVLLGDGSVLVFSGDSDSPGAGTIDRTVEHLRPPSYTPRTVSGGERTLGGNPAPLQTFPSLHLVPGGRVFYTFASWQYPVGSGTTPAQRITAITNALGDTSSFQLRPSNTWADPNVPEGQWQYYPNPPAQKLREEGTAVLLPPAQAGKILLIGGGWWDQGTQRGTPTSCEILNTQTSPPTWSSAGQMHLPRVNANAVLLPNGRVLIFGGHENYKRNHDGTHPSNEAEIYDPKVSPTAANPNAPFTKVAIMKASRMYHATGVLLPDATVLVAGGEDGGGHDTFGFGVDQRSMEIYEPPYCHQLGTRPQIDDIVDSGAGNREIHYGRQFTILTPDAANTDPAPGGVVLMRTGCTTHHTDSEQRLVHLTASVIPGGLRVQCPEDPNVAPPSYYMLFIVDRQGLPCKRAHFVRLDHCVPPKDACVAPVFKGSHWWACLLLALIAPLVIAAYVAGLVLILILEIFAPGTLAKYLCGLRRFLYRLAHCREGNRDPCLPIGPRKGTGGGG